MSEKNSTPELVVAVLTAIALFCGLALSASPALAQSSSSCGTTNLPANDDRFTSEVPLGFSIDFGGTFDSVFISNNGYMTFGATAGGYTPQPLIEAGRPIIAPFWADVDTSNPGSAVLTYGTTTYDSRPAFCVRWPGVGYFPQSADLLNDFGVILVDRSDVSDGSFDIVFEYGQIEWTEATGSVARAGFAARGFGSLELPGTGIGGAFLDTNQTTGLVNGSRNAGTPGTYVFEIRGPLENAAGYPALPNDDASDYPSEPDEEAASDGSTNGTSDATADTPTSSGRCPAGYVSDSAGGAKTCTRTIAATETTGSIATPGAPTGYSCPAGYTSAGSGASKTCTRSVPAVESLPLSDQFTPNAISASSFDGVLTLSNLDGDDWVGDITVSVDGTVVYVGPVPQSGALAVLTPESSAGGIVVVTGFGADGRTITASTIKTEVLGISVTVPAPAPTAAPVPVVTPTPIVIHVAVQPAPAIAAAPVTMIQAPVVIPAAAVSADAYGFGASLPAKATAPAALAHTGGTADPLLFIGLGCIATGAIMLGSRRRAAVL